MMRKEFTLLLLLPLSLLSKDVDFDGVDDSVDKCLNTDFSSLVDKDGCSIENLDKSWIVGLTYGNLIYQDTINHYLLFNLNYQDFYIGISIDDKKNSNYLISYNYQIEQIVTALTVETSFKDEYSFSADISYLFLDSFSMFGGYVYNSFTSNQRNYLSTQSQTFFGGISKTFNNHSISTTYSNSTSIIKNEPNIQTLSLSYDLKFYDFTFGISTTKNIDKDEVFYSSYLNWEY